MNRHGRNDHISEIEYALTSSIGRGARLRLLLGTSMRTLVSRRRIASQRAVTFSKRRSYSRRNLFTHLAAPCLSSG